MPVLKYCLAFKFKEPPNPFVRLALPVITPLTINDDPASTNSPPSTPAKLRTTPLLTVAVLLFLTSRFPELKVSAAAGPEIRLPRAVVLSNVSAFNVRANPDRVFVVELVNLNVSDTEVALMLVAEE